MQRYLIKTGVHAGKTIEGKPCVVGQSPAGWNLFGVEFPSVDMVLADEPIPHPLLAKHPQDTVHWESLAIPFDRYGQEIRVGDYLYVGVKNAVHQVRVLSIGEPYHPGYGIVNRKLTCSDLDNNRTRTINTPGDTIRRT